MTYLINYLFILNFLIKMFIAKKCFGLFSNGHFNKKINDKNLRLLIKDAIHPEN